jgi:hypothetical protein
MSKMGSHVPFGHLQHKLWPQKVENQPDSLVCRWRATHRWKAFDEGYNFGLDLIPIGGLHKKLWTCKVVEVPTLAISRLPLGNLGTKSHLDATPAVRCKVYYMGEGGGFPRVRAVVSLVSPKSAMALPSTKVVPTCANQLVCWFCVGLCEWVKFLFILPSPIPELQHALLPL